VKYVTDLQDAQGQSFGEVLHNTLAEAVADLEGNIDDPIYAYAYVWECDADNNPRTEIDPKWVFDRANGVRGYN